MADIKKTERVAVGKEDMPDLLCSFCGGNPREGEIGQVVCNQANGAAICYGCAKDVVKTMERSMKIMEEALAEAEAALKDGIKKDADGNCMCPRCIAQRKIEAGGGFVASEVVPSSATRH